VLLFNVSQVGVPILTKGSPYSQTQHGSPQIRDLGPIFPGKWGLGVRGTHFLMTPERYYTVVMNYSLENKMHYSYL